MYSIEDGDCMKVITNNENETYELGKKVGRLIKPSSVISLNGDLGAGKTHFTKGLAAGLEVNEYITSPSFTILNEYEGRMPLYHFDVYRIDDIDEMYEVGFEEYLYGSGVCVVEWGDMVFDMLPEDTINIRINSFGENTREIVIEENDKLSNLREMIE